MYSTRCTVHCILPHAVLTFSAFPAAPSSRLALLNGAAEVRPLDPRAVLAAEPLVAELRRARLALELAAARTAHAYALLWYRAHNHGLLLHALLLRKAPTIYYLLPIALLLVALLLHRHRGRHRHAALGHLLRVRHASLLLRAGDGYSVGHLLLLVLLWVIHHRLVSPRRNYKFRGEPRLCQF